MVRLAPKWDDIGTSIFSLMSQKAVQCGAVNLAQGFPDFDGPEVIRAAAIQALSSGLNQYAPSPGLPELRQLLARRQAERTGVTYGWEAEVTVFSGATEAIFCALQAYLTAGDEIIAFEPCYDSYGPAARAAGAAVVHVPLVSPDWRFDPEALRRAVTPRTRALLLNSPHNPTGRVFDQDELTIIRAVALDHDLLVITDEVYDELVFAPAVHRSLAAMPGMRERTLTISSTAKTYSYTGWKVGYAFGPAALMKPVRTVHQFTVFCSATPLQAGMIAALKLGDEYFAELRRGYREKRDGLVAILRASGFRVPEPEGTYFALADYTALADRSDVDFANWLTETVKVAAIPISGFYGDPVAAAQTGRHVRFAFCKSMETLREAGVRLKARSVIPSLP